MKPLIILAAALAGGMAFGGVVALGTAQGAVVQYQSSIPGARVPGATPTPTPAPTAPPVAAAARELACVKAHELVQHYPDSDPEVIQNVLSVCDEGPLDWAWGVWGGELISHAEWMKRYEAWQESQEE